VLSSQAYKFDISQVLDLGESVSSAAEIFPPEGPAKAALFCFPGGACTREYFDLSFCDAKCVENTSYSFARSMAQRGYLVITIDHLGVGESTRPQDGFLLTPERVVQANEIVVERLIEMEQYRQYANSALPKVAVGHSLGALLAICQQAWHQSFDGLAMLGFGHGGVPEFLCELGKDIAEHPTSAMSRAVELAKAQFGQPYLAMGSPDADELEKRNAEAGLVEAVRRKSCDLIAVLGALTLVPNVVWEISREVTVPSFAAMGDRDICGDFTLQSELVAGPVTSVLLENTRHNHFMFPGRTPLYKALDQWIQESQL
jgi:pimeloyl-ACP methyl ester carboxylesterase